MTSDDDTILLIERSVTSIIVVHDCSICWENSQNSRIDTFFVYDNRKSFIINSNWLSIS